MDYSERVRLVAIKTNELTGSGFRRFIAFDIAFRKFFSDDEVRSAVWIGVKSFCNSWREQKKATPKQLVLISTKRHTVAPTSAVR